MSICVRNESVQQPAIMDSHLQASAIQAPVTVEKQFTYLAKNESKLLNFNAFLSYAESLAQDLLKINRADCDFRFQTIDCTVKRLTTRNLYLADPKLPQKIYQNVYEGAMQELGDARVPLYLYGDVYYDGEDFTDVHLWMRSLNKDIEKIMDRLRCQIQRMDLPEEDPARGFSITSSVLSMVVMVPLIGSCYISRSCSDYSKLPFSALIPPIVGGVVYSYIKVCEYVNRLLFGTPAEIQEASNETSAEYLLCQVHEIREWVDNQLAVNAEIQDTATAIKTAFEPLLS